MNPMTVAFDLGETAEIVCINKSRVPFKQWRAGKDFPTFIAGLQAFADLFANFWHIPCKLEIGKALQPGKWGMVFTDDATIANALGYHDTTPDGYPLMHNFVRTTIMDNEPVSVTASHELAEALVDPCINLCAFAPNGVIYAYEVCDAVEQQRFQLNGMAMSDFQFPSWFEGYKRKKYDYMAVCTKPFQILRGGYMPVYRGGQWGQIFGHEREILIKPDRRRRSIRRGEVQKASTVLTWDPDFTGQDPSTAVKMA